MKASKSKIDLNIRNLKEVVEKCDFKGTASAFSQTLREMIESYRDMKINGDEYSQYMDKATKILDESKCECIKNK